MATVEIEVQDLSGEHLANYQALYAVDPEQRIVPLWDSKRLPPFVAADHPGTLMESLYVRVPSLSEEDLDVVRDRIGELDVEFGRRRLLF